MATTTGSIFEAWRAARGQWRQTGDVSPLAEVAAAANPHTRLLLLDTIVPAELRNEVVSLLRCKDGTRLRRR